MNVMHTVQCNSDIYEYMYTRRNRVAPHVQYKLADNYRGVMSIQSSTNYTCRRNICFKD